MKAMRNQKLPKIFAPELHLARDKAMYEAWRSGRSWREIAAEYGITWKAVVMHVRRHQMNSGQK